MSGTTLGFLLPTEAIALVLAGAGLCVIVGLRGLARWLLVAAGAALFLVPFANFLVASLPAPLRLLVGVIGAAMAIAAITRFLLGRKVWELVLAHVVSHAVITAAGFVFRLALIRAALLGSVGGLALWLFLHRQQPRGSSPGHQRGLATIS